MLLRSIVALPRESRLRRARCHLQHRLGELLAASRNQPRHCCHLPDLTTQVCLRCTANGSKRHSRTSHVHSYLSHGLVPQTTGLPEDLPPKTPPSLQIYLTTELWVGRLARTLASCTIRPCLRDGMIRRLRCETLIQPCTKAPIIKKPYECMQELRMSLLNDYTIPMVFVMASFKAYCS